MIEVVTAPNSRNHPQRETSKNLINQLVGKLSRKVHNHPSGDPTPSHADIDMTKTIVDIARPLGISVHDHIIIGKKGYASMKSLRLI